MAPASGRFAFASLWVRGLPGEFDLNHGEVLIDGRPALLSYIGPETGGITQLNVGVPSGTRTGLVEVELHWLNRLIAPSAWLRVIPPPPAVPFVRSVTDGVNLLSGTRIVSGSIKVTVEEASSPVEFSARIGGLPVRNIDVFCADPGPPRYEINFDLPETLPPGLHTLEMTLNGRRLEPASLEVAPQP